MVWSLSPMIFDRGAFKFEVKYKCELLSQIDDVSQQKES